jgi:two-component system, chemotaxis family, sensor kinase CheA
MSDLVEDFIADVRAGYDRLASDLARWTIDPHDDALLDSIFRYVHTVHGNAGFLNFERFGLLASAAEEALAQMRDGRLVRDEITVATVIQLVERLGALAVAVDQGVGLSAIDETRMIAALNITVPPLRMLGLSADQIKQDKARSVRLSRDQFDQLAQCFEHVAAAHRDLLGNVTDGIAGPLTDAMRRLTDRISEMDQALSLTRLLSVERLFVALDRIVAQTAESLDKKVVLQAHGTALMIDRDVVDGLRDPLLHLIRNALDHGFETPAIRLKNGKTATGSLHLWAQAEGRMFTLIVADDGAGINRDALIASAAARDIHLACAPDALSDSQITALACMPGVTTAPASSALSGRGVGLDAVQASVARLGGTLAIADRPGRGVTFTLRIPLRFPAVIRADAA